MVIELLPFNNWRMFSTDIKGEWFWTRETKP